ncbi:MAG: hypothetical protein M3N46_09940 [Actinomycetota bacterium]|nr:hypothetical protein [Actinomycetota bacterium]
MTQLVSFPPSVRDRRDRRPARTQLDAFPRDPVAKWILRGLFAIPFLLVAWAASYSPLDGTLITPNHALLQHIASIDWNRADVTWIGQISPPLSTLLAAAIPGGQFGLAVAGALIAGVFLQKVLEIMVQRQFHIGTTVILMLALAANPLFAYTATQNFAAFLGLAFFGLGIADIVRFVAWGNTQSGFRAGLYLMLAVLSDLSGFLYVLTAASAAPFLRLGRSHQRGARGSNVLVIVFPSAAAIGAIVALNWIFVGSPLGTVGARILAGTPGRFAGLGQVFATPTGWLLLASVASAWVIALIVRRPGSIIVSSLVFVAIMGAYTIGLLPPGSAGNTFLLMTLMAIALVPTRRALSAIVAMDVVAVLQIVIAWATAFNRDIVIQWMDTLLPVLNAFGH